MELFKKQGDGPDEEGKSIGLGLRRFPLPTSEMHLQKSRALIVLQANAREQNRA